MSKYLRKFQTSDAYDAAESTLDKPNVSYIVETNEVEFKPYVPPRNDIIIYTADAKLEETTDNSAAGLHTNAFNTTIKSHTFENGIGTIEFNDDVTSIGNYAFYYCGITSVTIPSSVTNIGYGVFSYTRLTNITSLATTAATIQSGTFNNIKKGGTLTVPNGSTGYDVWMGTGYYYLGFFNWTKVEQ